MSWLWAVVCTPILSDAAVGWSVCCLAPIGGVIGLVWAGISFDLVCHGFGRAGRTRAGLNWLVATICLAWVVTAWASDTDLAMRIMLSERSLIAAADGVPPDRSSYDTGRVGLFGVHRIERSEDGEGLAFETVPVFLDSFGLLYLPPGSQPPCGWRVREHLTGHWYRGYWQF